LSANWNVRTAAMFELLKPYSSTASRWIHCYNLSIKLMKRKSENQSI
jgi:hypothetical protein